MYENKSKQDLIKMLNTRNEKIETLEKECLYLRECLKEIDYKKMKDLMIELETNSKTVKETLSMLKEEKAELLEAKIRISNMVSNIDKII